MTGDAAVPATKQCFDITDEATACRLAQDIAAVLQTGDLVTLSGDLGAGKTTLARAMIRSAAGKPALEVPSPTFPIRIDYRLAHIVLSHVDLYRLAGDDDALELGLDEALETTALIVEWPDRITWPGVENRLDIEIRMTGERRDAEVIASGSWPARLERSFHIRRFFSQPGFGDADRLHVVGDASSKAFERIVGSNGQTAIVMNAPARQPGPKVWHGRTYDDVAHRALDVLPFLAVGAALAEAGVHVPQFIAHDRAAGLVLMEDLGAETIIGDNGEPVQARYEAAIDLLAHMHGRNWPEKLRFDGETYTVPHYDPDAMLIEISLFADWHVPHVRGRPFSQADRQAFLQDWQSVLSKVGGKTPTWVMRDFHSPNILWQHAASGLQRVGVIDIQDTLVGHPAYDVASLAQDARVAISEDMETALYRRYCDARRAGDPQFDEDIFAGAYAILGAQRATKVLGAFTRLSFHDGKPGYEAYLDRVKIVLARNLRHPVLSGLHVWYAGLI
jgi:tRNA threonylcarbamoyl adenosine modification protein YjeE